MHAAGSYGSGDVIRNPCWSPDGSSMLFARRNSNSMASWAQEIWKITPDSGEHVSLSDDDPDALDDGAAWYGV